MEQLLMYLGQYHKFSLTEVELIKASTLVRKVRTGDFVLEKGEVPCELIFVSEGALCAGHSVHSDDEVISCFVDHGSFATDVYTFVKGAKAPEWLRAVVDTTLTVVSRERYVRLSARVVAWEGVMSKIAGSALLERIIKRTPVDGHDARTKFLAFEARYPTLAGRIPKSIIASYLGLGPATLSRVRSAIRRETGVVE